MFGWFRLPAARASRARRSTCSGVAASERCRTLIATSRGIRGSRARYTSPMPPSPSGPRISYGPRWPPDERRKLAAEVAVTGLLMGIRPWRATDLLLVFWQVDSDDRTRRESPRMLVLQLTRERPD